MTSQPQSDDEIAGYLIGQIDMTWGWDRIDKAFAHAYTFSQRVVSRAKPYGEAHTPNPALDARDSRVREIVAQRWKAAAEAHSDLNAKPSGL